MIPHPLHQLPDGTMEAIALISNLNQCFVTGFANLDRNQEILASLCRVFTGTPLQQPLTEAVAAIKLQEFQERHFAVLAAARASVQGSIFDTLQQQTRAVLGRTMVPEVRFAPPRQAPAQIAVLLKSIRHWLMEIALVGFTRLDTATLTPFIATLGQIQAEPLLMRQAALLTGFFNELSGLVPVADISNIPVYRWVDLWTQAMVGALHPSLPDIPTIVSGKLELLGLDLRHHANLVSFTAYGLLTTDTCQLVRITLSAYKVDAIAGKEIWLLFPNAAPLLEAFAQNRALYLNDAQILSTGDLLWHGNSEMRDKYDLMSLAAAFFTPNATKTANPCLIYPGDRHPVQLAEPIFLQDYTIQDGLILSWGDSAIPIATERISPLSEITREAIAASTQIFGLLRFDAGGFSVQPLAIALQSAKAKPKTIFTGQTAADILKKPPKTSTVAILQERASRLLRQKS